MNKIDKYKSSVEEIKNNPYKLFDELQKIAQQWISFEDVIPFILENFPEISGDLIKAIKQMDWVKKVWLHVVNENWENLLPVETYTDLLKLKQNFKEQKMVSDENNWIKKLEDNSWKIYEEQWKNNFYKKLFWWILISNLLIWAIMFNVLWDKNWDDLNKLNDIKKSEIVKKDDNQSDKNITKKGDFEDWLKNFLDK